MATTLVHKIEEKEEIGTGLKTPLVVVKATTPRDPAELIWDNDLHSVKAVLKACGIDYSKIYEDALHDGFGIERFGYASDLVEALERNGFVVTSQKDDMTGHATATFTWPKPKFEPGDLIVNDATGDLGTIEATSMWYCAEMDEYLVGFIHATEYVEARNMRPAKRTTDLKVGDRFKFTYEKRVAKVISICVHGQDAVISRHLHSPYTAVDFEYEDNGQKRDFNSGCLSWVEVVA